MPTQQIVISTDKSRLDVDYIHQFLSEQSYWAKGRSRVNVENSIVNSLCFGVYAASKPRGAERRPQIGFARVVTDFTNFAWLCDVFVDTRFRGRGIGKLLIETVANHPELRQVGRFILATYDAHELYRRYGFDNLEHPERLMSRK
jgi:GNAT superfamily N-acetyltransferase